MNIEISEIAVNKIIENALSYNTDLVVRIYVDKVTCCSARFAIAFDNKRDGDEETVIGRINFLTDTQYMPQYSDGIKIDYTASPKEGFLITSLNPRKTGCENRRGCGHKR